MSRFAGSLSLPASKRGNDGEGFAMKVVLFCGGLGLRIRDAENIPKPMVTIGYRPILWHVMKYYAHYGHKDFVLCLGHRGDAIKNYFLNYSETLSNDFTLSEGGKKLDLMGSDIHDWKITFVETGKHANIRRAEATIAHAVGADLRQNASGVHSWPGPVACARDRTGTRARWSFVRTTGRRRSSRRAASAGFCCVAWRGCQASGN